MTVILNLFQNGAKVITKRGSFLYYISRQGLLEHGTTFKLRELVKNVKVYYKTWQMLLKIGAAYWMIILLQNGARVITKRAAFLFQNRVMVITKPGKSYKTGQLLQNGSLQEKGMID